MFWALHNCTLKHVLNYCLYERIRAVMHYAPRAVNLTGRRHLIIELTPNFRGQSAGNGRRAGFQFVPPPPPPPPPPPTHTHTHTHTHPHTPPPPPPPPPWQNGRHFADAIFWCIFVNEKFYVLIKISVKFVPTCPIYNNTAFSHIIAWRRIGDKPLSELMLTRFTDAYICDTRGRWVKKPLSNHQLIGSLCCLAAKNYTCLVLTIATLFHQKCIIPLQYFVYRSHACEVTRHNTGSPNEIPFVLLEISRVKYISYWLLIIALFCAKYWRPTLLDGW